MFCNEFDELMSHMTIFKIENKIEWKKDSRLSCDGLFDMAIDTYLQTHKNKEYNYLQTHKNKEYNQDLVEKAKEMNNKIYICF